MHRLRVSALLLAVSVGTMVASADSWQEQTPLWWSSATAAFGLARLYNPVHTVMFIEELDAAGTAISLERGETRTEWSGANSRVVVVGAEKNGKDTSDQWRKRFARQTGTAASGGAATPGGSPSGGPPPGFDATPFDPKYAPGITRGAARSAGSFVEIPYTIKTDGGPVEGVAKFSNDGTVMSATQRWTKPPPFVAALTSTIEYGYRDGALVIAGMTIDVEASILLVRKHYRMRFEFLEWARKTD